MFRQLFCCHDYETEKMIQTPSKIETMKHSGADPDDVPGIFLLQMCEKKLVIIQKCKKCQKTKITTVTT